MRRLFLLLAVCLTTAVVFADDSGNGYPNNGNPYPNNNGNGNGYPNNNGNGLPNNGNNNGNGNGYPHNNGNGYPSNGNNNVNPYPNNNGNNGNGYPNNNGNGYPNNGNNGNGYPNNFGNANNPAKNAVGSDYAQVVQKLSGQGTAATAAFGVSDKWEVFYFTTSAMEISIISVADGKVITGVANPAGGKGCLYVGRGGAYYVQFDSDASDSTQWYALVAQAGSGTKLSDSDGGQIFSNGAGKSFNPPAATLPPNGFTPGANMPPNNFANNGMGNFNNNGFNVPPAAPAPIVKLTEDQTRAVVLIKGDKAEGTGFLIKTPDGPQVVTNIHVIADNPNLKVTTNTGALITVLSEKGALDRDLAMLAIKDNGYSYLDVETDISTTVQPGDEVVTPGNSQGGEVMLNTGGKVLGIGPERIEFDNPIYHGNSGGPVFHTKSGKVLGVVTEAIKVDTSDDLDKVSFSSRNSAISGQMRYFGLRLDTVSAWIPIDSRQFQIETMFLDQFHEQSRNLDAYLNSDSRGRTDSGKDVSQYYMDDEKIMKAVSDYKQGAGGGDASQQLQAQRDFVFNLQSIADINTIPIKNANNFYSFDQERARDELDYRNALKKEIDSISGNVERMSHLPRTNN